MKNAIIAAAVAALVSSGATIAATRINGHAIAPHSIPTSRLAAAASTNTKETHQLAAAVSSTLVQESNTVDSSNWPRTPAQSVEADCPTGYGAVGGGYSLIGDWSTTVEGSSLTSDGLGWTVQSIGASGNGPGTSFKVEVTCEPN